MHALIHKITRLIQNLGWVFSSVLHREYQAKVLQPTTRNLKARRVALLTDRFSVSVFFTNFHFTQVSHPIPETLSPTAKKIVLL